MYALAGIKNIPANDLGLELPGQRARRNPALRRKRMPFRKRSDQRFTVDVLND